MYQTSIRNKKKHSKFNNDREMNYNINKEYEEYAYVLKLLGNCRVKVLCNNGTEAIGVIRGSLRKFNKRVLIENGDLVVISKRDYQDNKVDIVHKFNSDQCQNLIKTNEISKIIVDCYYNKINDNIISEIVSLDKQCLNFENIMIYSDNDSINSNHSDHSNHSEIFDEI